MVKEIIRFEPNTSGTKEVEVEKDGAYQLVIKADKAREAINLSGI